MLPVKANTTCDVYRSGHAPPSAPDVAGVAGYLTANYYLGLEHGEGDASGFKYDHVLIVDTSADVRDGYSLGTIGNGDTLYIPNQNGTKFNVVFVGRKNRNLPGDARWVYLQRQTPPWPTTNL